MDIDVSSTRCRQETRRPAAWPQRHTFLGMNGAKALGREDIGSQVGFPDDWKRANVLYIYISFDFCALKNAVPLRDLASVILKRSEGKLFGAQPDRVHRS